MFFHTSGAQRDINFLTISRPSFSLLKASRASESSSILRSNFQPLEIRETILFRRIGSRTKEKVEFGRGEP